MAEKFTVPPQLPREQAAIELTRFLVRKHYCENDFLADESLFDEPFLWFGAAEQEFAAGRETVLSIFRRFQGQVPRCNITEEEYHAELVAPDVALVAGRMWIATDPDTGVFLRVHQRITTCVRWREGKARCCMLHVSNPYSEMDEEDVGFPTGMARQSREYMKQQLDEQKALIARQAAELSDIYSTISCGILRLLRTPSGEYRLLTFNPTLARLMDRSEEAVCAMDWSQGFGSDVAAAELPALRACLDRLRQPGDHTGVDYRIRTEAGRTVYLHSSNDFISHEPEGDVIQRLTYDVTARMELEQTLKRLSFEDSLTGLFNRNHFNQIEERMLRQPPARLGVVCVDLNGLKEWNDRRGHLAGDDLIRRTAARIARAFPGQAHRMGGDEFLILDTARGETEFRRAVEQLVRELEEERISAAIGTSWRDRACDIRRQIGEADRLMYQEKQEYYRRAGRGREP